MSAEATALPGEQVRITTESHTEPFWQAAKDHRLVAPQCGDCGCFRLPPTPCCPECQSTAVTWTELSGPAEVFSYSVMHGSPGLPDIMIVAAVLYLPDASGARLVSNIVDCDSDKLSIGDQVQVFFSPISEHWKSPLFRLANCARKRVD